MELRAYLTIIGRRWRTILIVTLIIGVASVFVSQLIHPKYQAEASLRVTTPVIGNLGDISYATSYTGLLINTYVHIATSEQAMDEVKRELNLSSLPDIKVSAVPNSEVILISVSSSDASLAAETANTLADVITSKSRKDAVENGVNSEELDILTQQQTALQKELDQAKQDRQRLVESYAQATVQMGLLDSAIRIKEASYQNLQNQYQQTVIDEAVASSSSAIASAKATKDLISKEIDNSRNELSDLQKQYGDLSASSTKYNQQLVSTQQTVQNNETAYLTLMSQIMAAKIADSKHQRAQDIIVVLPAIVPVKPSGPGPILIIVLGFLLGLIGGVMLAFLMDNLSTMRGRESPVPDCEPEPLLGVS